MRKYNTDISVAIQLHVPSSVYIIAISDRPAYAYIRQNGRKVSPKEGVNNRDRMFIAVSTDSRNCMVIMNTHNQIHSRKATVTGLLNWVRMYSTDQMQGITNACLICVRR